MLRLLCPRSWTLSPPSHDPFIPNYPSLHLDMTHRHKKTSSVTCLAYPCTPQNMKIRGKRNSYSFDYFESTGNVHKSTNLRLLTPESLLSSCTSCRRHAPTQPQTNRAAGRLGEDQVLPLFGWMTGLHHQEALD